MSGKVLVVDDDRRARETVAEIVEKTGAGVLTAKSGFEAIVIAQTERPDVIILDGQLPELHEFEVARYIRSIPAYRPLIVLVTAIYKGSRYEKEARLTHGIGRYLTKPVNTSDLLEALTAPQAHEPPPPPAQPAIASAPHA